jgi:hypothetical protein
VHDHQLFVRGVDLFPHDRQYHNPTALGVALASVHELAAIAIGWARSGLCKAPLRGHSVAQQHT